MIKKIKLWWNSMVSSIYDSPVTKLQIITFLEKKFPKCAVYVTDPTYTCSQDFDELKKVLALLPSKLHKYKTHTFDCLSKGTKVLDDKLNLINIEDVNVGDRIFGKHGRIDTILDKKYKGVLKTLKILLNNGTDLNVTPNHPMILKSHKVIKAIDLKVGFKLKKINNLDKLIKVEKEDVDYWYLVGLYVADGWLGNHAINISGKDGFPKEKQKEWVKDYCIRNNINYSWYDRHIAIRDIDLRNKFSSFGTHAIEKQIPLLPKNKKNVKALLKGLAADAYTNSKGTTVYGTISKKLSQQIRILFRVIGISSSIKSYKPTKTQFGTNIIYRIIPRLLKDRVLKVTGIMEGEDMDVYDLTMKNKHIYLPEQDCLVHNCDNFSRETWSLAGWLFPYLPLGYMHCKTAGGLHAMNIVLYKTKGGRLRCTYYEPQTGKVSYVVSNEPYLIII